MEPGVDILIDVERLRFSDVDMLVFVDDFDVRAYVASHTDLTQAFRTDFDGGFRHYVFHGAYEARQITFDSLEYIASYGALIGAFGANADAGAGLHPAGSRSRNESPSAEDGRCGKAGFSEEQIIGLLREQEVGATTAEVCRRHGVSEQTFYRWKAKYGGMRHPMRPG